MPELPEVETTRRLLAPAVEGRRLIRVELRHPRTGRRQANPQEIVNRLTGRTVLRLERRGKFLLGVLDEDLTWVVHLGMSGRFEIGSPGDPHSKHTHFLAGTDAGREVRFVDPRTFGFVAVLNPDELSAELRLGRDALSDLPETSEIEARLANRRAPIKSLLLDQRLMAGLGNIYADEVLFRAGIRPTRPGGQLTRAEIALLRRAIGPILRAGITAGGTSLSEYGFRSPLGRTGTYGYRLRVYGRVDEPCLRCGTPVERIVIGGRSSYFCPHCQS